MTTTVTAMKAIAVTATKRPSTTRLTALGSRRRMTPIRKGIGSTVVTNTTQAVPFVMSGFSPLRTPTVLGRGRAGDRDK